MFFVKQTRLKMKYFFSLYLFLSIFSEGNAQEIPNEFFEFKKQKYLNNAGKEWKETSLFGPARTRLHHDESDSLLIETRMGLFSKNESLALYGYAHFTFKKYFYAYLYPRIVNDVSAFDRYSGIPREIERGGLNSGETDLSGIGFQNDWLLFQIGRGRQSWGAGEEIQLALGENSPAYEYTLLGLDFGKIRVKYLHGFLESISPNINRYITARGLEWFTRENLIIGLSETVIYSGENRPIDLAYLNPISNHLEMELNDRLNTIGTGSANGVWQLSVDYKPFQNFRLSGNLLYDEFVLDKIQFEQGKENGKAYSLKGVYTISNTNKRLLMIYSSFVKVGTPTFRHGSGSNNFVQRNKPLGWKYGSDGQAFKLGLQFFNLKNLMGQIEFGQRAMGEESILLRPYDDYADYLAGPFPSGLVEEIIFFSGECQWWWKTTISVLGQFEWTSSNLAETEMAYTLGIDIYYPHDFWIK